MVAFNREQWVESCEGQLSLLRPRLSQRLRTTHSNQAWHKHGAAGDDPIKAAKELSAAMDRKPTPPNK
jgi:hypothetical protein